MTFDIKVLLKRELEQSFDGRIQYPTCWTGEIGLNRL